VADSDAVTYQFVDEKLSANEEAKDRLIERLKSIISHTQKNPDYRNSVQTVVTLIQNWFEASKSALKGVVDGSKIKDEDESAKEAMMQLKSILEIFAGQSLDPVIDAASEVILSQKSEGCETHGRITYYRLSSTSRMTTDC
jgi:hypothetical protein